MSLLLWTAILVGVLLLIRWRPAELRPPAGHYERLEGILWSETDQVAQAPCRSDLLPEVTGYVDGLAAVGLAPSTSEFRVRVLQSERAPYRITLGPMMFARTGANQKSGHRYVDTATSLPSAFKPSPQAASFETFDELLKRSDATYALSANFHKDGISLRLDALGTWSDLYLLKFVITNTTDREFFISGVEIRADDHPLATQLYMPYSCPPSDSVEGIITFAKSAVHSKKVGITVIESGGHSRRLPIREIRYHF